MTPDQRLLFDRSFQLRLAGYAVVRATWDGANLVVHVLFRTTGYQEVVVGLPSGPVQADHVVVIDDTAGGSVIATIPIPIPIP